MSLTLRDHSWPWRWSELQRDEAGSEAIRQLEKWRDRFALHPDDTWVMDAAIHTILAAAILGAKALKWAYNPPKQARPVFDPRFPQDRLERAEESQAFKRWYMDVMKKQLDEYIDLAVGYHQSVTYAEWTARSWSGETAQNILDSLDPKAAAKRTRDSIQKDIQRFARSVGLTRLKKYQRSL
jgi:hypothetical protein